MKKEVKINDKVYFISKPTTDAEAKAKLQQSRTFSQALREGACLRTELNKSLDSRGVWTEEDNRSIKEMSTKIQENLDKLDQGGFDVMEARQLAIETGKLRSEMVSKLSVLREHNSLTAEGQADDAYFDSLVSSCCFDEDGNRVFKSYQDYINKSKEEYAIKLASEFASLIYGNFDYVKQLPENQFLSEFGFVNEDLEYIDENGNKVDVDYQPIPEPKVKPERKPFTRNGEPIIK